MFEWLLALMPVTHVAPPPKDYYIGVVAAEVGYVTVIPDAPVTKPLVDTKDCKKCNGTGRIRTGDDQHWTDCPDCEPKDDTGFTPADKPRASMELQVKPLPPVPPTRASSTN